MATLVLTHGAGSHRDAPLLVALDRAFSAAGITVHRRNLAFREERPSGPPRRGDAERDRAALAAFVRSLNLAEPIWLGGHSYGGRQSTMLASEDPSIAARLLLLSYPLHPPRRPEDLRTAHFGLLRTPAMFVHGTRDPFGSIPEMESALQLIPSPTKLLTINGAGHDLSSRRGKDLNDVADQIVREFLAI